MKINLYCVFDRVAEEATGNIVMTFKADAAAIRTFGDIASDPQSNIHKHITDFELHRVATFDTETLDVEPNKALLITGELWLAAQQRNNGSNDPAQLSLTE